MLQRAPGIAARFDELVEVADETIDRSRRAGVGAGIESLGASIALEEARSCLNAFLARQPGDEPPATEPEDRDSAATDAEGAEGASAAEEEAPGTTVAMPAVEGMMIEDAIRAVTDAGLAVAGIEAGSPALAESEEGIVERAVATVEGPLHLDDGIVLYVHTGKVESGSVPDVVGWPLEDAAAAVKQAGFVPVLGWAPRPRIPPRRAPSPAREDTGGTRTARARLSRWRWAARSSSKSTWPRSPAWSFQLFEVPRGTAIDVWIYGNYVPPDAAESSAAEGGRVSDGSRGGAADPYGPERIDFPTSISGYDQSYPLTSGGSGRPRVDTDSGAVMRPAGGWPRHPDRPDLNWVEVSYGFRWETAGGGLTLIPLDLVVAWSAAADVDCPWAANPNPRAHSLDLVASGKPAVAFMLVPLEDVTGSVSGDEARRVLEALIRQVVPYAGSCR